MHRFSTWLLVLGVFAGLHARVMAQVGAIHVDTAVVEDCCHGHDEVPVEDEHGPDCPPEPHHHHHHSVACCGVTLVMEEPDVCRIEASMGLRIAWRHPDDEIPDGPVLLMDKPPLI